MIFLQALYSNLYDKTPDSIKPYLTTILIGIAILAIGAYNITIKGQSAIPEILIILGLIAAGTIYNSVNNYMTQKDIEKAAKKIQENHLISRGINSKDRIQAQIQEAYDARETWVDKFSDRMRKIFNLKDEKVKELKLELFAGGMRSQRALSLYITSLFLAPPVGFLVGFLYAEMHGYGMLKSAGSIIGGGVLAGIAVRYYFGNKAKIRRKAVNQVMPEVIDLMVIYARAGAASDTAIKKIGESIKRRYPTVSEDILILYQELQIFSDRRRAFVNFKERQANSPIVSGFCAIMIQNAEMGSSIAESLFQLSTETKRDRLQIAKKKAAKLPVLMQGPIIIFIVPALFLIILGPAAIKTMKQFHMMN